MRSNYRAQRPRSRAPSHNGTYVERKCTHGARASVRPACVCSFVINTACERARACIAVKCGSQSVLLRSHNRQTCCRGTHARTHTIDIDPTPKKKPRAHRKPHAPHSRSRPFVPNGMIRLHSHSPVHQRIALHNTRANAPRAHLKILRLFYCAAYAAASPKADASQPPPPALFKRFNVAVFVLFCFLVAMHSLIIYASAAHALDAGRGL